MRFTNLEKLLPTTDILTKNPEMLLLGIYRSRKGLNSDLGKEKITLQTTCLRMDTEPTKTK